jgi:hypothetical protein
MKGEFFYANAGFSEVFYGLNPNRASENIYRKEQLSWLAPSFWCLEFGPELGNSHMMRLSAAPNVQLPR